MWFLFVSESDRCQASEAQKDPRRAGASHHPAKTLHTQINAMFALELRLIKDVLLSREKAALTAHLASR